MSHNHYLECRACGVTTEVQSESQGTGHAGASYSRFAYVYGDSLVKLAPATRSMWEEGIPFTKEAWVWARFAAEHSHCNAFWEVCSQDYEDKCGAAPRRILVESVPEPECPTCHGRRVVPCPECK